MKKSVLILSILVIFLLMSINISVGFLGYFPQNSNISLHQVCDNCTFVNLTSISFPNGSIQSFNIEMIKTINDYTYFFFDTNLIGPYSYNTCGDQDGILVCENIPFIINPLGEELTTGRGIIYILLTVIIFLLFLFLLYVNLALPMKNETDNRGRVVRIVKKKYIKIGLIPITYTVFIWFLNLLVGISTNLISGFDIYLGMIDFVFFLFMRLSYIIWVVCLVWFMYNWLRDLNWNKQIKKFGRVIK